MQFALAIVGLMAAITSAAPAAPPGEKPPLSSYFLVVFPEADCTGPETVRAIPNDRCTTFADARFRSFWWRQRDHQYKAQQLSIYDGEQCDGYLTYDRLCATDFHKQLFQGICYPMTRMENSTSASAFSKTRVYGCDDGGSE